MENGRKSFKIDILHEYGISNSMITHIKKMGYKFLTKLQEKTLKAIFNREKNLIISAPTNSGKTFIAELIAIKKSLQTKTQRFYFLFPLKALAEEKYLDFKENYDPIGIKTAISSGDYQTFDSSLNEFNLIVITYEKLLYLILTGLEKIENISLVVIDEIQMIGDYHRGASLEMLLTILTSKTDNPPRIVGLSASLNKKSAERICNWLNAELISHDFREIELREGILYNGEQPILFHDFEINKGDFIYQEFNSRRIQMEKSVRFQSPKVVKNLSQTEPFLLFYNTRPKTENEIAPFYSKLNNNPELDLLIHETELMIETTPTFKKLKRALKKGVGYHHSGLVQEERFLVRKSFKERMIGIIASTTGLGAGVNTPTKNVIFNDMKFWNGDPIPVLDYKNMAGRAGRLRQDIDFGRSIIIVDNLIEFDRIWKNYVLAQPEDIISQLGNETNLVIYILNSLLAGLCQNNDDLLELILDTYFGTTSIAERGTPSFDLFKESFSNGLNVLMEKKLIFKENGTLKVSKIGKIITTEGIFIETGETILESLNILLNEASMDSLSNTFDKFIIPIIHLACSTKDALKSFSVVYPPKYYEKKGLRQFWNDPKNEFITEPNYKDHYYQAIKTTKIMLDWINGLSFNSIWKQHKIYHGQIRSMARGISRILGVIIKYSRLEEFNFSQEFFTNLEELNDCIYYGVQSSALELMRLEIPEINRYMASLLINNEIKTLEQLNDIDIQELTNIEGISRDLALRILKKTEFYIRNTRIKILKSQVRRALEQGQDPSYIKLIHQKKGIDFEKACFDLFNNVFKFDCTYCGEEEIRTCDFYFSIDEENYTFECKKITGKKKKYVSTDGSQEVVGKSLDLKPICMTTIGYPEFSQTAKEDCKKLKITLLTVDILGELTLLFWKGKIDQERIIKLLRKNQYITLQFSRN